MKFNPEIHHRHSIRLKEYDYSQAGAYFATICAWQLECLFGDIADGGMVLNDVWRIVADEWERTSNVRPNVELDRENPIHQPYYGRCWLLTLMQMSL